MLIHVSVNPETGFRGADYDFYTEVINGKWSEYLHQLSSTGDYALVESRKKSTEPFGANEVRQFTSWVTVPLPL